ncbi:MAG: 50S ribosomal protein L18 [Acidobacteriota bacterium]
MAKKLTRNERRLKVHESIRKKISGTGARPRLCVFRSLKNTYAQLVDDSRGETLAAVSTLKVGGKKLKNGGSLEAAKKVGAEIAEKAKASGIREIVFDRGGYIYHGRVKALAEAAREAGLKF